MAAPSTNYQFSFNGFLLGAGTPHAVTQVDGLEALPALRTQDDNQGYSDGMFSGRDFYSGRDITIQTVTLAGDGYTAQQNFNLLQAAMLPQQSGTTTLQFQLSPSDSLKRISVRVRKRLTTIDPDYTYGFIKSTWQLFAPDPRYYDDVQQSALMSVSNPLGRTYNRTYNLVYGGGSLTGSTTVLNDGWVTTYPVITANGPFNNPTFGNVTTGQYITLQGSFTNTDIIVIDLAQRLVTLNGSPARNLLAGASQWFSAPAGTNYFYMTGKGVTAGLTSATVSWRSAYV